MFEVQVLSNSLKALRQHGRGRLTRVHDNMYTHKWVCILPYVKGVFFNSVNREKQRWYRQSGRKKKQGKYKCVLHLIKDSMAEMDNSLLMKLLMTLEVWDVSSNHVGSIFISNLVLLLSVLVVKRFIDNKSSDEKRNNKKTNWLKKPSRE